MNFRTRWAEISAIAFKEILEVLRDRRSAFFTFLLPLILYPLVLIVLQKAEAWDRRLEGEWIHVGVSGDYQNFIEQAKTAAGINWKTGIKDGETALAEEFIDLHLHFNFISAEQRTEIQVGYDGARPLSTEALRKIRTLLEKYRKARISQLLSPEDSESNRASLMISQFHDVSSSNKRGEIALSRLLPALLVLLLITGGAFVAIDIVAGEKERGTLETLLVHPVRTSSIAWAKFIVVLTCSVISVILNLFGMFFAYNLGLGPQEGMLANIQAPEFGSLLILLSLLIPLAVFTSSILLLLSTRSTTFREAQTYLFPAVVLGVLPALISALPNVPLNVATAIVPVANVALVVRQAVTNELTFAPFAITMASTSLYAFLAVSKATRTLETEEALFGKKTKSLFEANKDQGMLRARRACYFGAGVLLFLYYVAPVLQDPDGLLGIGGGLLATLWGAVLLPAGLFVFVARVRWKRSWALKAPPSKWDWFKALSLIPTLAVLITAYMALQESFLPFSQELTEAFRKHFSFEDYSVWTILFIFSISPAICEEFLWRGTVQHELEKGGRVLSTILLVGFFFGLFHFSVHRFVPTFIFGCILAFMRYRSRSIFPGILLHAGFNALVIFVVAPLADAPGTAREIMYQPFTLIGCALLAFVALKGFAKPAKKAEKVEAVEEVEIEETAVV